MFDDPIKDTPCMKEYLIAHHILNQNYSSPEDLIEDIMKTFGLTRQVAVIILDGRSFNRILDKMIKAKDTLLGVTIINGLAGILETGNIKQKLKAIKLIDYLYRMRLK